MAAAAALSGSRQQNEPQGQWAAALAPLVGAQKTAQVEYLWPENVAAWQCWVAVQTQWRVGMAGATGLDYAGVSAYLTEAGVENDERRDIFAGIRAAEAAVLEAWADKRRAESRPS